jgi:hypothetical protein
MRTFVRLLNININLAQIQTMQIRHTLGNLEIPLDHLVGLSSDGAADVVGRVTGVGANLTVDNPSLLKLHCDLHELQRDLVQAVNRSFGPSAAIPVRILKVLTLISQIFR